MDSFGQEVFDPTVIPVRHLGHIWLLLLDKNCA